MADTTSDEVALRIQRSLDDLPPLSPTVAKVLQIANNPDSSANDLVQVIKLDPVLTGKVLRLINSPFFGMENVTSVARALVVLGFNTVKNLALSSALAGVLSSGQDERSSELWEHSLGVGVAARTLSRVVGMTREEQESAFIGGLMHDLGKVLTSRSFQLEMKQCVALQHRGVPELEAERKVLGTTHEVIGAMLAHRWKFPAVLITCIEAHHVPRMTGPGARESCLISLANSMYYRQGLGSLPGNEVPPLHSGIWAVLGITQAQAEQAMAMVPEELEAARAFLGR